MRNRKSPIMVSHRVVYMLLLVLQVMAQQQPESTGAYGPQLKRSQVPAFIIGMLMFTLLFSFLACCICYRYTSTPPHGTSSDTEEGGHGDGGGGGGGPWMRRTSRGIEKEVIKTFPSFLYSQVKGLKIGKGGVECAICLNEFEDDETLRLMPPCSHAFHADCIDVWLSSRATCPVCRANLSIKLEGDQNYSYTNQEMGPETGNAQRSALESPDVRLLDGVTWSNNSGANRPPRSRSTGSSNWRITEIFFPRSHSTGHSLVPIGENLDRFTLQLPEDVRRQLVSLSHTALPQARSSRQGYRSGSVRSERRGFPYGRQFNRRTISLSFSFSFQSRSLQSSPGIGDLTALPNNLSKSVKSPYWKISEGIDKEIGEGSFERLRPEMV